MCLATYVTRFFKALCLILAIGWVPMTQHCRLEAMGALLLQCEHSGSTANGEGCARDGCNTLEGAGYKTTNLKVAVAAPTLVEPLFVILVPTALTVDFTEAEFAPQEQARPENWVPSWQFVRRAAPPSRAPSVSLA